ncbi:hypothetical protein TEQG_03519 [Trichophyton equinum CBS 127.97]|uniref:Uncharacterized protein n=1 Tax=Trichophyton equinum (strain ATCC MYA-4606 / CBS 127.97) TaxID=559882 RepID=F2PRY3_TRIEC|nr:hypothetical protein TEQG_03519 [Trichophyton equinum CBS 127.97]
MAWYGIRGTRLGAAGTAMASQEAAQAVSSQLARTSRGTAEERDAGHGPDARRSAGQSLPRRTSWLSGETWLALCSSVSLSVLSGRQSVSRSVGQSVGRSVGRCWEQRGSLKVGGFWHILPPYNTTTAINDRSYACIEDPKALNT